MKVTSICHCTTPLVANLHALLLTAHMCVCMGLMPPSRIHSYIPALHTRCIIIDRFCNGKPHRSRRVLSGGYNGCVARAKGGGAARWCQVGRVEWLSPSGAYPPPPTHTHPPLCPPAGRPRCLTVCVCVCVCSVRARASKRVSE